MLPLFILLGLMGVTAYVGSGNWRGNSSRYFVIAAIAFVQTLLVLVLMYTMKVPKGKFLP